MTTTPIHPSCPAIYHGARSVGRCQCSYLWAIDTRADDEPTPETRA